ncbi:MAG: hypothetical protein NC299_00335 [Lachnospiraceae bacterium]|nr:hypothetical protein [Lachnospiraceae bacterium]
MFHNDDIEPEEKFYPMMFVLRNLLELHLKELASYGKNYEIAASKLKRAQCEHNIMKILEIIKPMVIRYAIQSVEDEEIIKIIEREINNITKLDKNGDRFRYPTDKNLQYFSDDGTETVDVQNVYNYMMGIINSIDAMKNCFDYNASFDE